MTSRPTPLLDIALATALLTRLPIPVPPDYAATRGAGAAWAYPLAGVPVAAAAGILAWVGMHLGLPAATTAGLVIVVQVVLTGAMHEDGLADTADGLWGGWSRERRLEIMKDSRIGSYGVMALILSVGLRWSALSALGSAMLPTLIAVALISRATMIGTMTILPNARADGLSKSIGRPGPRSFLVAAVVASALSMLTTGGMTFALIASATLAALGLGAIARAKIGGQTGDILGATQQVSEIAALATAATLTQ
ncbi:adenosylcobinamide-GDP ribazoletransferase [Tropicimonas isoalkanivorans]|uniref:Adenosylcobinamide-GDP ribazoletransferase n=1 Tax=Tropicimonas isoalkanivorans TaxID=441112 RepID=A0A1I1LP86_9RHOB|nr:adenosylcobinamide-GDP ribazoletransferase [Tropicimonas isoalkanivorans]SFC72083.1 cobalamin-5'-phosphate synthase [Tropicimonas isoalkanivorans]